MGKPQKEEKQQRNSQWLESESPISYVSSNGEEVFQR